MIAHILFTLVPSMLERTACRFDILLLTQIETQTFSLNAELTTDEIRLFGAQSVQDVDNLPLYTVFKEVSLLSVMV